MTRMIATERKILNIKLRTNVIFVKFFENKIFKKISKRDKGMS